MGGHVDDVHEPRSLATARPQNVRSYFFIVPARLTEAVHVYRSRKSMFYRIEH